MSKDHTPGDFNRTDGYKSDLEIAETGPMVKSVNTSFGSGNHNAYIHRTDGTHEHFYYSPEDGRSGWHGHNWETRNNHPKIQTQTKEGEKTMERNSFIESLKADKATIDNCNEVSLNAAKNNAPQNGKTNADDGGRERGDSGPGSLGRESGNKSGITNAQNAQNADGGENTGGQGVSGQSSGGQGGH